MDPLIKIVIISKKTWLKIWKVWTAAGKKGWVMYLWMNFIIIVNITTSGQMPRNANCASLTTVAAFFGYIHFAECLDGIVSRKNGIPFHFFNGTPPQTMHAATAIDLTNILLRNGFQRPNMCVILNIQKRFVRWRKIFQSPSPSNLKGRSVDATIQWFTRKLYGMSIQSCLISNHAYRLPRSPPPPLYRSSAAACWKLGSSSQIFRM